MSRTNQALDTGLANLERLDLREVWVAAVRTLGSDELSTMAP
jgi:hypothetical protein